MLDEEDEEDSSDPFEAHFATPDSNVLIRRLKALEQKQWTTQKKPLSKTTKAAFSMPEKEETKASEPASISGPNELKLKQKLANTMANLRPKFNDLEKSIAPLIFGYQDILYCQRTTVNADSLRRLTCLHAINHIFK